MMAISQNEGKNPLPNPIPHTVEAIYATYERVEHERSYLGISTMGNECDRALWYSFRWAAEPERRDGRKRRLLETGHREEARMVGDLRKAGLFVEDLDPSTQRQWEVSALGGHLLGHMDGRVTGILEAPTVVHLLECKTHSDKSFKELVKHGVTKAKPEHYAQMQGYMHLGHLTRAFYLAHNKNTDDLYGERVSYDPVAAARLMVRAEKIVYAPSPLPRLFDDPNAKMAFPCGYCPARPQCHGGAFARVNCRTCLHSTPVDSGWHCERFNHTLDKETQRVGCSHHLFIPGLVPGEQVDANEQDETVTYRLPQGLWVDGVTA